MTERRVFTKAAIWLMDSIEFTQTFLHKPAIVYVNKSKIEGLISEIGLASNLNIDSIKNLPVSIKILVRDISITDIERMEIL